MATSASLRRFTRLLGLLGVLASSLAGCGGGGSSPVTPPDPSVPNLTRGANGIDPLSNAGGRDVCRANASVAGRAKWTVLVFMNAANNLQPDSLTNIAQMAKVGSNANVNIVVQWKQAVCEDCGSPSFTETRRYKISQHNASDIAAIQQGVTAVLDADLLPPPPAPLYNPATRQVDMGDYRVLNDFVKWGAATYPSDHLAVIVWDHGAGWRPSRAAGGVHSPTFRSVSEDNETKNDITTQHIPTALAGTPNGIDALIFDASLMQMIEVAYEVRNSAKIMVGSEDSPPGAGYPYDLWLNDLKNGSAGANPCTLGADIVTNFVNFYRTTQNYTNVTQSLIDLSKMQNVADKIDAFASQLRLYKTAEKAVLATARDTAQKYYYGENKDLISYCELIRVSASTQVLKDRAYDVEVALRGGNGSIMASGAGQFQQDSSYGQAIYIQSPGNFDPRYYDIAFSKPGAAPNWAKFLSEQAQ